MNIPKKHYLFSGLVSIITIVTFVMLIQAIVYKKTISKDIKETEKHLTLIKKKYLNNKPVENLTDELDFLEGLYDKLSKLTHTKSLQLVDFDIDPVTFKEDLFQQETNLRNRASLAGVILPEEMGFADIKDTIPKKEQLHELALKKNIHKEILTSIFDSGIKQVFSFGFTAETKDDMLGVTTKLSFLTFINQFLSFIVAIENSSSEYIIKSVNIYPIQINPLETNVQTRGNLSIELEIVKIDPVVKRGGNDH